MNALDEAFQLAQGKVPGWALAVLKASAPGSEAQPVGKAYSREYLEEALSAARQHLPGWAYAMIHQHAMPRAGGRVKNAPKAPAPKASAVEQAGMRALSQSDLKTLADTDLLSTWEQMQTWYDGAPDEAMYNAATQVMTELESRGVQVDRTCGLGADATVCKLSEGAEALPDLQALATWLSKHSGETLIQPASTAPGRGTPVTTLQAAALAARLALDAPGARGVLLKSAAGSKAILHKDAYSDLALLVPTRSPVSPALAFIGAEPNRLDAARGEPLCGADGVAFLERYLAPLGLSKQDVMLTHVVPMAQAFGTEDAAPWQGWVQRELDAYRPPLVVALGRVAKDALGERADFVLPHPAVMRRHGDSGELVRKLAAIRRLLEQKATRTVQIVHKTASKRITYGVALDPYQFDSQKDWVPPADIEQTAHRWMEDKRVIGMGHVKKANAVAVESHVVHYPSDTDYRNAMENRPHRAYRIPYGDQYVHSGAWILGVKVLDSDTWGKVEKGEIAAYSIGGTGVRTEIDPKTMPHVTFIELRGHVLPGAPAETYMADA